jgi:hypothetical protein
MDYKYDHILQLLDEFRKRSQPFTFLASSPWWETLRKKLSDNQRNVEVRGFYFCDFMQKKGLFIQCVFQILFPSQGVSNSQKSYVIK